MGSQSHCLTQTCQLSAELEINETSLVDAKRQTNFGFCENLADQLVAIYSKASVQFVPGQNMMPRKSIINKLLIDWKIAMEVDSHKKFKKKDNLLKRIDSPLLHLHRDLVLTGEGMQF